MAWMVMAALSSHLSSAAGDARQPADQNTTPSQPHNVILFVTDGLRHDSVTMEDAPTIYRLRHEGVDFVNSHSLFPTVTTANASALATGHGLGDTGNFANSLFDDREHADEHSRCQQSQRKLVFDMEDNLDLALLNCLHSGADHQSVYLGIEHTLISLARAKGYNTAVVGKLGPGAIQDIPEVALQENLRALQEPATWIIDGATGSGIQNGKSEGFPFPEVLDQMRKADLRLTAPDGSSGKTANVAQQKYFTDIVVKIILPKFKQEKKPFLLIFWSADPDRTQHNQEDSPGKLEPGINGATSKAAIHNADNNLSVILKGLDDNGILKDTDIIVTADHGFSTISKGALDAGSFSQAGSYAADVLKCA